MNEVVSDDELYQLVCQTSDVKEFDAHLERLPNVDDELKLLRRYGEERFTLLMLASLKGNDQMVRAILSHSSDARHLVDIAGTVFRHDGTFVKNATALWCACDRGHYHVARTLIEIGHADIEHGPRYPLLIDATINGRLDTIRFLTDNGYADVQNSTTRKMYKLNCLIMAVIYGRTQVVEFLLHKGVELEYTTPSSQNTPLGYASVRGHLDIVSLLCSAGACTSSKNRYGQTPLMLAARHGRMNIVNYFIERNGNQESINQLELVACSFIITVNSHTRTEETQFQKMVNLMHKIFEIRKRKKLPKFILEPIAAYAFQKECETIEEFCRIEQDRERLCLEALMIRERIMVPQKDETLFKPLLVIGDKLVARGQYERCLDLWEHVFYLYQNMNIETALHRFVWLFCKMLSANVYISPQRFVQIGRLALEPSQQKPKDDIIKNVLCLVAVAVKILEKSTLTKIERQLIYQWIIEVCRQKRTTTSGQNLLHLCVDEETFYDINYRPIDIKPVLCFPNLGITQILVNHCSPWIDINAAETNNGNTALHISSQNRFDSIAVIQCLLDSGAHIDSLNKNNQTPLDMAQSDLVKLLLKKNQLPQQLKCLCARLIVAQDLPYDFIWPKNTDMNAFLFLHGAVAKRMNHC